MATDDSVWIIAFWNGKSTFDGAHVVAASYNGDGVYTVYNYYNNDKEPRKYSLNEIIGEGEFIIGYRLD